VKLRYFILSDTLLHISWDIMKALAVSAALLAAIAYAAPSTSTSAAAGFKWFGVSESCAEFGQGKYPGLWGKDFTFPAISAIDVSAHEEHMRFAKY